MKLRISYFYQIRNFKRNMLPISTAIGDPKWFHDFQNNTYIFKDKRNILNGIRCETIIQKGKECGNHCENCNKDKSHCEFLSLYYKKLCEINFNDLKKSLEWLAKWYAENENIKEEIILVLMVHETPRNPCSERESLIKYFTERGIECKELDYPI